MFPNQDAVNRHVYWTDPVLQFMDGTAAQKARFVAPRRIIGVTADVDDAHVVPEPTLTIYSFLLTKVQCMAAVSSFTRGKSLCAGPVGHAHYSHYVRRSTC